MKRKNYIPLITTLLSSLNLNANCISDGQPDNADSLTYISNLMQQVISLKSDNSAANYKQLEVMSLSTFNYIKDNSSQLLAKCNIHIDTKYSTEYLYEIRKSYSPQSKECKEQLHMLTAPLLVNHLSKQYNNELIDEMMAVIKLPPKSSLSY